MLLIMKKLLILLLCCVACTSSSVKEEKLSKVLKINLKDEPATLDPAKARDLQSITVMHMLFEGLVRIDPTGQPQLALAKSVAISHDLKTYTFILRPANWSTGEKIKASDFVLAWQKILTPDFHSDVAYQLYVLKNGKRVKQGENGPLGVRALDEQTLVVELEHPAAYFLELLSFPAFFPLPPTGESYNGPFLLDEWKHLDQITVKKNPSYWDAKTVQLNGIQMVMVQEDTEFKLFEKGQLHWAGSPLSTIPVDAIATLKKTGKLHIQPIAGTSFLRIQTEIPPLQNSKIRKALALAIERKAIVDHVTQGGQIPAFGLLPPSFHLAHDDYFHDGAKEDAKRLFEEGLAELGLEQMPTLTFTYASNGRAHLIAQAIQQQWKEALGISINLESIEPKIYIDKISHKQYQIALGSWIADYNDPINFLEVFKFKAASTNNTEWESPEYIRLLDATSNINNPKERYALFARSEQLLIDAMPIIPLFHYTMLYLKDDRLKGAILSNLGSVDFKWASLDNPDHE